MNFDEWWARNRWCDREYVWEAATKAEREACAKICEVADKSTHPADLADLIRSRGQTND